MDFAAGRGGSRLKSHRPVGVGHEFLVGHHREGVGLLGDDRGAHVRLGEQLHLEARAAHLGGVGGVLLGQGGPQGFHPAGGHAVEVTGGIRGAALNDGGGAGGQQAFFDPLGEALVSGHPLGVAGPQQCEPHVRQRTLRESGSEQVVETLRVVRGLAVVAGGHHDKQALRWAGCRPARPDRSAWCRSRSAHCGRRWCRARSSHEPRLEP